MGQSWLAVDVGQKLPSDWSWSAKSQLRTPAENMWRWDEGLVDLGILGNQRRMLDDCGGERPLVGANVNFEEVVARCIGKDTSECPYDGNIGCWNTSLVTDMTRAFSWQEEFNEPIGLWDLSSVTDTTNMFRMASSFNQPLDNWNVSNVEYMVGMFAFANSFNQPLDKWNVSKVKNMNYMFADATSFNRPLHAPWYVVEQSESE